MGRAPLTVRVLDIAARDIQSGYRFYERRSVGLGVRFVASIMAAIRALEHTGGIHLVCLGRYHRVVCRPFPYAIYYRVDGSAVFVHAVIDCRRDPARIERRLT